MLSKDADYRSSQTPLSKKKGWWYISKQKEPHLGVESKMGGFLLQDIIST